MPVQQRMGPPAAKKLDICSAMASFFLGLFGLGGNTHPQSSQEIAMSSPVATVSSPLSTMSTFPIEKYKLGDILGQAGILILYRKCNTSVLCRVVSMVRRGLSIRLVGVIQGQGRCSQSNLRCQTGRDQPKEKPEASSRMSRYPLYNDSFWNLPLRSCYKQRE